MNNLSNAARFDEKNTVFSFGAISDLHIYSEDKDDIEKLKSAVSQLVSESAKTRPLDAIAIIGDIADSGRKEQLGYFRSAYESVLPTDIKTLLITGNHDSVMGECLKLSDYESFFGDKYFGFGTDTADTDISLGVRDCLVCGYHFLLMEPANYSFNSGCPFTEKAISWLDTMLSKLTREEPHKYIFVGTHPMIYDTCYGSTLDGESSYWSTTFLSETLSKYPQVITLGGHLHFPVNDSRTIMQDKFTALGCGSVRYMAIERGGYENMASPTTMRDRYSISTGLLIQADAVGNIRIIKMFFSENATYGEPWVIPAPRDDLSHLIPFSRARADKNAAPELPQNAVSVSVGKNGAKEFYFAAGSDDEYVHHYTAELKNASTGESIKTYKILSDFYRHTDFADMKKGYGGYSLPELEKGDYIIVLTAIDAWDAKSEPQEYKFSI